LWLRSTDRSSIHETCVPTEKAPWWAELNARDQSSKKYRRLFPYCGQYRAREEDKLERHNEHSPTAPVSTVSESFALSVCGETSVLEDKNATLVWRRRANGPGAVSKLSVVSNARSDGEGARGKRGTTGQGTSCNVYLEHFFQERGKTPLPPSRLMKRRYLDYPPCCTSKARPMA